MPEDHSPQPDFNSPDHHSRPRRFTHARPRPVSVWIVFLVLFMQGFAVLWYTFVSALSSQAQLLDGFGVVALIVLQALFGLVLILLGFRLFMGTSGARTPAMVLQFMMVVLSFSFFAGGAPVVGAIFLVPAAIALVLLFVRPTQAWLEAPDPYRSPEA